ncbi:MAG: acyltransferase [Erysipelotrichaceae bacterium]
MKNRNENMDMLRFVAICFVVCIHYVGWGGVASATNVPIINYAFAGGVSVACNCAVNCFYMISGYFIRDEETVESCKKRIQKIWVPTFLYSVLIGLLLVALGEIQLSGKQLAFLFLPVFGNQYWFSTCFIAMTMFLPFLAKMLRQLDRRMLLLLVAILLIWDSIIPTIGVNAFGNIGYGIIHALTMYVIGYTVRKMDLKVRKVYSFLLFIGCVTLIGGITIGSIYITGDRNRTIADYNSILMIVQSVSVFLFFNSLNVTKFKFSKLAPYVFGVYLLNDHPYARTFLWQKIFHCQDFYNSPLLPLHCVVSIVIFVVVAMTIEYIRINSWKKIASIKRG